MNKLTEIRGLIGNTPLCKIICRFQGVIKCVYAKLEWYNLTGSIKDRVAYYILEKSYKNKNIVSKQEIVETTSGNTGISFACLGGFLGNKVTIIMPDHMSMERKKLLELYGANLRLITKEEGGFVDGLQIAKTYKNAFFPLQFENDLNSECHYNTTGLEICKIFEKLGLKPKGFIAGVGTGGTLMGVGKRIKSSFNNIKIVALEPKSSPILKMGYKTGNHKIEGISDDFIPPIYDCSFVDKVFDCPNDEAIFFAQKLARAGLGVGISSGANFYGAISQMENDMLTIFADDNKKYLSTYLCKPLNLKYDFEILNIEYLK